jgi:hypothetical protein
VADKKPRLDELDVSDLNGEKTRIVDLYTKGCTLTYIAQVIGKSPNYVSKILHQAYQEDKAERDVRILAHSQMIQWLMGKTVSRIEESGKKWDRRDGEFLLKLSEQERKLKGLDQPVQHELKIEYEQVTDEELVEQLRQFEVHVSLPERSPPLALPEPIEDAQYEQVDVSAQRNGTPEGQTQPAPQGG